MFYLPLLLFIILIVWGLISGEIYPKEAAVIGCIGVICAILFFVAPGIWWVGTIGLVILDIVLMFKLGITGASNA